MKTLKIENFKYGLDARREELARQPGTLLTLQDCFINSGGEIEKRKAFVDSTLEVGTSFGLVSTEAGLTVFGTSASPGLSFSSELVYQQLVHPYEAGLATIRDFIFAINFNGKAFVCVEFSDGMRFLYYDGALVTQSSDGLVIAGQESVTDLSIALAAQLDMITSSPAWNGEPNTDEDGNYFDGVTLAQSPVGISFTPTIEEDSVSGVIGTVKTADQTDGSPAVKAKTTFTLTIISGNVVVSAPPNSDGTGVYVILATVNFITSAAVTAAAVVAAINTSTYLYGYTATNTGAAVTVYAPLDWGDAPNTWVVGTGVSVVLSTGSSAAGGTETPRALSVTVPSFVTGFKSPLSTSVTRVDSGAVTATPNNGTPPYVQFTWSECDANGAALDISGDDDSGILISNPSAQTTTFHKYLHSGDVVTGYFKCKVQDTPGAIAASNVVQVQLELGER